MLKLLRCDQAGIAEAGHFRVEFGKHRQQESHRMMSAGLNQGGGSKAFNLRDGDVIQDRRLFA